jgi:hypothetical protein
MYMPQSDQMVEKVYDTVNKQLDERTRTEVARAALLAAQHRAAQLAMKRTAPQQAAEGNQRNAH